MSEGVALSLARDLAAIVGEDAVLTGADTGPYETDATASRGVRGAADAVVVPRSPEEVADLVAFACLRGVPLVPRGGGTGLAGGAVPVEGGVVVSLAGLDDIREISPEAWRLSVGAGVTTATVRRLARENGLFFPPDPGAAEQSHIGGNVATNAGGPHAFKYGNTGAWVTGIEAAVPPGRLVRVGGDQRKDVGGYDIKSLLVGSEGTLGIITAVTLRLMPAPEALLPIVSFFADAESGCAAAAEVIATGIEAAALDFLDGPSLEVVRRAYPGVVPGDAGFVLISEVDGTAEEAARQSAELQARVAETAILTDTPAPSAVWRWRDGVSGAMSAARGGKVSEDIFVPLPRLADAIRGVHELGAELELPTGTWGHAGDGNLHASFLVDPADPAQLDLANGAADRLFSLAIDLGGGVTGEHGIGWVKRGQLARQWTEGAVALHEQIKRSFDPANVLNPGKKVARL
ncbi:MAG TPA: FAD-linked oxidase C-terminal domain-containing protein [Solirubrobacterales bacterium]|nr:FAD-linked oxidase C-terminal domain-containing protein [Solirubrobacterales bacterium]